MKKKTLVLLVIAMTRFANAEFVNSKACVGPNSSLRVVSFEDAPTFKDIKEACDLAKLLEAEGEYKKAAMAYQLASLNSTATMKRTIYSLEESNYELMTFHLPNQHIPPGTFSGLHKLYGKQIIYEKLEALIDGLPNTPEINQVTSVMKDYVRFMRDIELGEVFLMAGSKTFAVFGSQHTKVIAVGLLGYGVYMSEGCWQTLSREHVAIMPDFNVQTIGPLRGRAFTWDQDVSFVPGIAALASRFNFPAQEKSFDDLQQESVWEFCYMDDTYDDIWPLIRLFMASGFMQESQGDIDSAISSYSQAMRLPGYFEPYLKLYTIAGKQRLIKLGVPSSSIDEWFDIARILQQEVNITDSVKKSLLKLPKSKQRDSAIRHSDFVRDIFIGRIFTPLYREPRSNQLMGKWFMNEWQPGMNGWGVRLYPEKWAPEALNESDWRYVTFIESGFWSGYSKDSNGNILVAGLKRLQRN